MPFDNENDYDTTVLSEDYSDYHDTVVEQVIAFDPTLFQGSSGEAARQAQRPTWISAQGGQPPASQPPAWEKAQPTWSKASAPAASVPRDHNPDEDTWVLGSLQPACGAHTAAGTVEASSVQPRGSAPPAPQPGFRATASQIVVPRTTSAMMAATDSKPDKTNAKLIAAITGLSVVGVAAIIVVLVLVLVPIEPPKPIEESSSAAAAVVPAVPEESSGGKVEPNLEQERETYSAEPSAGSVRQGTGSATIVAEGGGRAMSESDLYDSLSKYYSLAGEYDAAVRSSADEFNANYLKEDKNVRSAKAGSVTALAGKIKSACDDLKKLEPPFMSKNTQAFEDLCELYDCLYYRIDVIDQAWKIDLQYAKPKEHQTEIVAPLRAQQVNGNDKYYTRFKELYPNVKLVKP